MIIKIKTKDFENHLTDLTQRWEATKQAFYYKTQNLPMKNMMVTYWTSSHLEKAEFF